MTNPETALSEMDITESDWNCARSKGRQQFVTPIEAELACRERQLLSALSRIASLESLVREMKEALVDVEWSDDGFCPQCASMRGKEHQEKCILGNGIKSADELLKESK